MSRKRTKRKLKVGRIIAAIGGMLGLIILVFGVVYFIGKTNVNRTDMYLASDTSNGVIYSMSEEENKHLTSRDGNRLGFYRL